MKALRLLALLALAGLAACQRQNMADQPRLDTYGTAEAFEQKAEARPVPAGTVPHGAPPPTQVDARPTADLTLLRRGHERFDVYCSPCHGLAGYGDGMVVQRGFPHPPSFHGTELREAPAQHFFDVITNGYGVMYSYADRVPPRDRWAIAAYIRALQLSQAGKGGKS